MAKRRRTSEPDFGNIDSNIVTEQITHQSEEHAVRLLVGKGQSFTVSRLVLLEVEWFRAFLSDPWKPAAPYHLPDDNAKAIRTILLILHHAPSKLPKTLSVEDLFHLAAVCDKYNLVSLILPHVQTRGWVDQLWEKDWPRNRDWEKWPWILQSFNQHSKAEAVQDVLAANMRLDRGKWVFERGQIFCHILDIKWNSKDIESKLLLAIIKR